MQLVNGQDYTWDGAARIVVPETFYRFGLQYDKIMEPVPNGSTMKMELDPAFPFFGNDQNMVSVSTELCFGLLLHSDFCRSGGKTNGKIGSCQPIIVQTIIWVCNCWPTADNQYLSADDRFLTCLIFGFLDIFLIKLSSGLPSLPDKVHQRIHNRDNIIIDRVTLYLVPSIRFFQRNIDKYT